MLREEETMKYPSLNRTSLPPPKLRDHYRERDGEITKVIRGRHMQEKRICQA